MPNDKNFEFAEDRLPANYRFFAKYWFLSDTIRDFILEGMCLSRLAYIFASKIFLSNEIWFFKIVTESILCINKTIRNAAFRQLSKRFVKRKSTLPICRRIQIEFGGSKTASRVARSPKSLLVLWQPSAAEHLWATNDHFLSDLSNENRHYRFADESQNESTWEVWRNFMFRACAGLWYTIEER